MRLHELRAGVDLLGEPHGAEIVGRRERILGRAEKHARGGGQFAARQETSLVAHRADDREQRNRIEIEDRLGLRVIAALHAVAGEAEHVADAERRRAEHVALDGDAVVVAAGDLQHRRIADAGQDRADRDARHVTMRAGAVGGVDAVDPALEIARPLLDVLDVGRIRRAELGGDGELAAPKHPLEPPARRMAGQVDERRGGVGADVVRMGKRGGDHPRAPAFSRASRIQAEEPLSAWLTGGRISAIAPPSRMPRLPS